MTNIRTKRRRVRQTSPAILRAIREELLTGASAPEVFRALRKREEEGEFGDDLVPSDRTISNIAREGARDVSGTWGLADGDTATVGLVLGVLAEVVRRTEGDVTSLTKQEARLIPIIDAAMQPRWPRSSRPTTPCVAVLRADPLLPVVGTVRPGPGGYHAVDGGRAVGRPVAGHGVVPGRAREQGCQRLATVRHAGARVDRGEAMEGRGGRTAKVASRANGLTVGGKRTTPEPTGGGTPSSRRR